MKRILLVVVGLLLIAGNAWADNSRFYGSFSGSGSHCGEEETGTTIFGNDISRETDIPSYFYIPLTGSSSSFSYRDTNGDPVSVQITISNSSLHVFIDRLHGSGPGNSQVDINYVFSDNYNTVTYSGTETSTHYEAPCPITGSGSRIQNKPSTPTLSSPSNGSTDVSLAPTLNTNAFTDPDVGDTHQQTDWQVSTSSDFSAIVLSESSTANLTSLTVPASLLQGSTTYYWRAKFYDNRGIESDWSSAYSFSTVQTFTDTNENGIPDNLENDDVDLNNDGITDIDQTDEIKTLNTVVGSGQIGLSIKESTTVTKTVEINSIDPDTISKYQRPHTMPLGLISFKLHVTNPGDTAYVKMYFSEAAPEDASWFFHDSINGWSEYSEYVTFSEDRMSASIKLKDGGHGDSDGVENGIIVDPCGFGIASWLKGKVTDTATADGLSESSLVLSDIDVTLDTMSDGTYLSMLIPGIYDMDVTASGYVTESLEEIVIPEVTIVTKDVELMGRCKITGLEVTGTPSVSTPVTLKVNAQSGSETINYRYSIHNGYGTSQYTGLDWRLMTSQEYRTENDCAYTFGTTGKSIIVAWATSSGTDSVDPKGIPIIGWSVDTSESGCTTNFTGVTITGEQKVNEKMTFAVNAVNSCDNSKYYRFSMHPYYGTLDYDGSHWESMTSAEWISSNSVDYTFTEAGKYIIVVWVSDTMDNVGPNGIPIIGWSVDVE